ncbi:hypothetical protein MPH_13393 [Macrophomina phaseolina MS6]|uniref:Uncharacterized protein n=1 Tax=Macrophomina phaseolina (strain MS6) TaxID=1126212 RepID=K2R5Y1_MACPH|nr:hypothetical protein MPH_13393 [Macrophomina phaseolina MS6]
MDDESSASEPASDDSAGSGTPSCIHASCLSLKETPGLYRGHVKLQTTLPEMLYCIATMYLRRSLDKLSSAVALRTTWTYSATASLIILRQICWASSAPQLRSCMSTQMALTTCFSPRRFAASCSFGQENRSLVRPAAIQAGRMSSRHLSTSCSGIRMPIPNVTTPNQNLSNRRQRIKARPGRSGGCANISPTSMMR